MSHFRVVAQFWEKCMEWPQNDLHMSQVKSVHTSSIPEAQIFVCFPLGWAFFKEITIFHFPIEYKVKINIHHQESLAEVWL